MYMRFWIERQMCRLRRGGVRQGGRRAAPKQARIVDYGRKVHFWPRIELSDRAIVFGVMGIALTGFGLVALLVYAGSSPVMGRLGSTPQALKPMTPGPRGGTSNPEPTDRTHVTADPNTAAVAQQVADDPGGGRPEAMTGAPATHSSAGERPGGSRGTAGQQHGQTSRPSTSTSSTIVPGLPVEVTVPPVLPTPSVTCRPRGRSGLPLKCTPVK